MKKILILSSVLLGSLILCGTSLTNINNKVYAETVNQTSDVSNFVLTMSEKSTIKFKDNKDTFTLSEGAKLTLDDFEVSELKDRNLIGVAVLDEEGNYSNVTALETFAPTENCTILPIVSSLNGYNGYAPATGQYGWMNMDGVPGTINSKQTIENFTHVAVKNSEGLYQDGTIFYEPSKISIGSGFRFDTTTTELTSENKAYDLIYTIENIGLEDVHLDGYAISSSSEYKNLSKAYESRYRMDVDLKPGETKEYVATYSLSNSGKNLLSYFVADATMNNMKVAMSISLKESTSPASTSEKEEEVSKTQELIFDLPEGITFSEDFNPVQTVGNFITLPTAEQIENNTSRNIVGWYLEEDRVRMCSELEIVPDYALTLKPCYGKEGQSLLLGSYKSGDYVGNIVDGKFVSDTSVTKITVDTNLVGVEDEQGRILKAENLKTNNAYRFLTTCGASGSELGIEKNGKYRFDFTVENRGDEVISFELYQISGSTNITGAGTAKTDVITLQPKAIKNVSLYVTLTSANNNAITMFVAKNDVANAELGISMSKNNLTAINENEFAQENTRSSLIVNYQKNGEEITPTTASIRFGTTLDKAKYYKEDAKYGVIFTPSDDMKLKTYDAYLDSCENRTLEEFKSKLPSTSRVEDMTSSLKFVDHENAVEENPNGDKFQFAAVLNGALAKKDLSITATVYMVDGGNVYLMDEATFSLKTLVQEYLYKANNGEIELNAEQIQALNAIL